MSASSLANTLWSARGFSGGGGVSNGADQALADREIELFECARTVAAAERLDWLERECRDCPDLLPLVLDRLSWEARMEGFLLAPVMPRSDDSEESRPFLAGDIAAERFEIVREIARGGMAVVYEAYDRKADRKVALKCPKTAFRKRLLTELHNALRVSHPNVCRLYEIHGAHGRDGEVDVLTMELLEGETLLQRLRGGALDRAEASLIARQLCAGLAEAHACGVVHGDLKPGNVILTKAPDGSMRAAITDFGLARSVGLMDPARLGNASLRGTPAYIAPELWQGAAPSPASDIYALGVMLRELLGAKNLPGRWEGILRSCVASELSRRPQSANLVGAALAPVRPIALWAACAAAAFAASGGAYYHSTLPVIPEVVRLAILPHKPIAHRP